MTDHTNAGETRADDERHGPAAHDPAAQRVEFVETLPDLIDAGEYAAHPDGRLVRVRISVTDSGVEVLGDAFRPAELERMLAALGGGPTEEMLCG